MSLGRKVTSRRLLIAGGAAAISLPRTAGAQRARLTVADAGGEVTRANEQTLYVPFRAETGIDLAVIAREHEPISQVKALVESRSWIWDVVALTAQQALTLDAEGMLEPLDWNDPNMKDLIPAARRPNWMAHAIYAAVLGYRHDKFGAAGPQSWADFWNVERFPGRRALRRHPIETLEIALMADGVPMDKVYPIDMNRAFASLDRIKRHIHVWWTGGAQSTQLLQSGEVVMTPVWNARLQAIIDGGTPAVTVWNQGVYAADGWGIPKGTPRAADAQRLVKFFARPDRQAARAIVLGSAPSNPKALATVPPERARQLPTAPENLSRMLPSDDDWWLANREEAIERFNAWLIR